MSKDLPPMMCGPCNLEFKGIKEINRHMGTEHPNDTTTPTAAYELKVQDFAKETQRTSELAKALKDMTEVFISEGHNSGALHARRCPRCELVDNAMTALQDTTYFDELRHQELHR